MQLQGEGPVRLLVVDCADTLNLRGYAKTRDDDASGLPPGAGLGELVGNGQLLLSLDMPGLSRPYQSYVPIEGDSVAEVFEHYLTQSEQQPALLRTACSGQVAACLFLQKLPDADLKDPDGWQRVHHLVATLRNEELLALPPEALCARVDCPLSVRAQTHLQAAAPKLPRAQPPPPRMKAPTQWKKRALKHP